MKKYSLTFLLTVVFLIITVFLIIKYTQKSSDPCKNFKYNAEIEKMIQEKWIYFLNYNDSTYAIDTSHTFLSRDEYNKCVGYMYQKGLCESNIFLDFLSYEEALNRFLQK